MYGGGGGGSVCINNLKALFHKDFPVALQKQHDVRSHVYLAAKLQSLHTGTGTVSNAGTVRKHSAQL